MNVESSGCKAGVPVEAGESRRKQVEAAGGLLVFSTSALSTVSCDMPHFLLLSKGRND